MVTLDILGRPVCGENKWHRVNMDIQDMGKCVLYVLYVL